MDRRHFQEFVFETSSNELSAVPPFFEWSDFLWESCGLGTPLWSRRIDCVECFGILFGTFSEIFLPFQHFENLDIFCGTFQTLRLFDTIFGTFWKIVLTSFRPPSTPFLDLFDTLFGTFFRSARVFFFPFTFGTCFGTFLSTFWATPSKPLGGVISEIWLQMSGMFRSPVLRGLIRSKEIPLGSLQATATASMHSPPAATTEF